LTILYFKFANYKKLQKEIIDITIDTNIKLLNITKMEKKSKFVIDNKESLINKSLFKEIINKKNGEHDNILYGFSNILNDNNYENYELIELIELSYNQSSSSENSDSMEINNSKEINTMESTHNIIKNNIDDKMITTNKCIQLEKTRFNNYFIERTFFDNITCKYILHVTENFLFKK
jgi:hypothetical protein